ncbi:MAG: ATP-binding cassette domain-containing protein [Alphaproteobacteria bacterium]
MRCGTASSARAPRRSLRTLPRGLDTFIGDRGGALSAGERQRIVLARALLRRPLLLVLDEATNALDWRDQAMIARSIAALRGSTTIVSIEHRPALITFADWVVEIENGRVIQEGPFETLSQRPGSRLARMVATETPRAVG